MTTFRTTCPHCNGAGGGCVGVHLGPMSTEELAKEFKAILDNKCPSCKGTGVCEARLVDTTEENKQTEEAKLEDLVRSFSLELLAKLRASEKKYNYGGAWHKETDWRDSLIAQINAHMSKGDPLDVAAYCAFAWYHGWSVSPVCRQ